MPHLMLTRSSDEGEAAMQIKAVDFVMYGVADMDRALGFYRDTTATAFGCTNARTAPAAERIRPTSRPSASSATWGSW